MLCSHDQLLPGWAAQDPKKKKTERFTTVYDASLPLHTIAIDLGANLIYLAPWIHPSSALTNQNIPIQALVQFNTQLGHRCIIAEPKFGLFRPTVGRQRSIITACLGGGQTVFCFVSFFIESLLLFIPRILMNPGKTTPYRVVHGCTGRATSNTTSNTTLTTPYRVNGLDGKKKGNTRNMYQHHIRPRLSDSIAMRRRRHSAYSLLRDSFRIF